MNLHPFALACLLPVSVAVSATAHSQTGSFTDPANLRGEHVKPSDGRELPVDQGARGLEQMLRRLNTRASILNIVAHPDDEDGGMLAFYSRGEGARVADMSLTRGEGGQNAVTGDFEDALGLLRTQELLSSDRYPGIDQFFGTEVDFGFSKTKEEAFGKWTHERVLYDAVRAIRLYRPLVITSTWIGGVTDGHGQHQVAGQIAQEAFKAAGDPSIFPELTREGIFPWQPLKVYARVPQQAITSQGLFDYATGQYTPALFTNYVTGAVTSQPPSTDVVVHEGKADPLLSDPGASNPADTKASGAHSYVQFARIGLGLQRSQVGPGVRNAPAGAFDVSYHRFSSKLSAAHQKPSEDTFFDGIDTSLNGIASLAPSAPASLPAALASIQKLIALASNRFTATDPGRISPTLADALHQTDALLAATEKARFDATEKASLLHELRVKRVQLNQALLLALGLSMKVNARVSDAPLHTPIQAEAYLTKAGEQSVLIDRMYSWPASQTSGMDSTTHRPGHGMMWEHGTAGISGPPSAYTFHDPCMLTGTSASTRPYFHRDSPEQPVYTLSDPNLRNAPATPPALTCVAELKYNGVPLTIAAVGTHDGQPVSLVPPMTVALSAQAQVLPADQRTAQAAVTVHMDEKFVGNPVSLRSTNGWTVTPSTAPPLSGATPLTLTPPGANSPPSTLLTASAQMSGSSFDESYRPVGYAGLPRTNFYIPARDRIVPVDLKLPSTLRLAYLPGTGDAVPEALSSVGLHATTLSVADLTADKLSRFDTVLVGVRAYAAHPELHGGPTQALLDFARNGGNVVLQYQTAEFTGADAPYPLALGRDAEKVVDEAAGVDLLEPSSPLLSTPNRISTADFGGWIEERGHGFLRTWSDKYSALTETHDPGSVAEHVAPQEPQRGGLITTPLGKGRWTYVAFALYRQVPAAVPGAFRLMVNLLNPVH